MMHKAVVAAGLALAIATPALSAEFYVALDTSTNECRVVTQKPDDRPTVMTGEEAPTLKMVGSGAYKSEAEAKEAMEAITECQG